MKLMDFGLARGQRLVTVTEQRLILGTLAYMSPEQVRGETVDHRADIYSLGVVLYEMLCGRHPYRDMDEMDLLRGLLDSRPLALPAWQTELPDDLSELVDRMMARRPEDRFQRIGELRRAIASAMPGSSRPMVRVPEDDSISETGPGASANPTGFRTREHTLTMSPLPPERPRLSDASAGIETLTRGWQAWYDHARALFAGNRLSEAQVALMTCLETLEKALFSLPEPERAAYVARTASSRVLALAETLFDKGDPHEQANP